MKKEKSHWFIRGINWIGVIVMLLSAPALFIESYLNREVAPWELSSLRMLLIGAAVCAIPHVWISALIVATFIKARFAKMLKKEYADNLFLMDGLKIKLAKDDTTIKHTAVVVMVLYATTIIILLVASFWKYSSDNVDAQVIWRCGGVPVIHTAGITTVVLWFFAVIMPAVNWINERFSRVVGVR